MMADGSVIKTALAKVYIDSPYFVGEVIGWCLQNPLHDVIIGNEEGARDPNYTELNHEAEVVTRLLTKKMAKPYSKLKVPNSISHVSVDNIKSAQQSDESLVKIGEQVKSEAILVKGSSLVKYYEKKGLWFREFQSSKVEKGKVYCQLIVPKQYRRDVIRIAHESIMAGHLATWCTVDMVTAELYLPGITSDVERLCRSCDICQQTVPKRQQIRAPLGNRPVIDIPFRRMAIDIVESLVPITDKGNRYILTLVDYATRYHEAVALPSIKTERVAEALVEVFCRVLFPREILTDRGAQFTSGVMAEMSRLISVKQLMTTPYHPMCNGLVERFNGTLKLMLKRLCAERPRDWDRYLGPALFAYREVPQESSRFIPFELLYGWPVRGP
jgi:transposase InsO family protein